MPVTALLCLVLTACASWQPPLDVDDAALRARAVSATTNGVRLSASVLSAEDSQRMFGANINATGVQPVWIEVDNKTSQMLWLLRSGTDPDYFSPLEVAWAFHAALAGETNAQLDEHFDALGFQNPIAPGATQAGVVFANPHKQTMLLNVDLLGQRQIIPFTLFPPVPDDAPDEQVIDIVTRFAETAANDFHDETRFRVALEQLPCCATGDDASVAGDPLNVVMVGEFTDIAAALVRRGYRRDRREFDEAQRLFQRRPDIVVRKAGQGGVPAAWMRMWVAPLRYQGEPVFLVQVGRPVGGRFAVTDGRDLAVHPDVDEARNLLVQDLLYSGGLGKLAFATGGGNSASPDRLRTSRGGGSYYSDGLRAVLFMVTRPLALSEVQILEWVPYLKQREIDVIKNNEHSQD
ncbi:MAG: hypothetical protein JSW10_06190 [Pseudomonadota bacterium]|nr:MAG: hypothetical protein JSW10_06190 [Pseudomonadota bacterium]